MKKSARQDNKGLKTFVVYGGIVLFFIFLSLLLKAVFIIQESKFDGKHQYVLNISKNGNTQEIIKFNPKKSEISVLDSKDKSVLIIPDAKVDSSFDLPLGVNVSDTLKTILFKKNLVKTDLTFFDLARLIVFSYSTTPQLEKDNSIKNFFIDDTISAENMTIQIVNASAVSGMGRRLEAILDNFGCNIVAVTTSRNEEKLSKIQFFGEKTYTLQKLEQLLKFPLEKIDEEKIADIIIVIGKDNKDSGKY